MPEPIPDLQTQQEALTVAKPSQLFGCVGMLFGFFFFGVFFLFGVLFLYLATIRPMMQASAAEAWPETQCNILSSEVRRHENSFSADISYEYEMGGHTYTSDAVDFTNVASNKRKPAQDLVDAYPVDSERVCFVDPDDPDSAVLIRETGNQIWIGLVGLPFLLVGIGGWVATFYVRSFFSGFAEKAEAAVAASNIAREHGGPLRVLSVAQVSDSDYDDDDLQESIGPVTLKPEASRWTNFAIAIVFFVFESIGLFIFGAIRMEDILAGEWALFPDIIFIPFGLIWLGTLAASGYCLLATQNPIPLMTLSRQMLPLGSKADIEWNFEGNATSIRMLKVKLEGKEEATYRRGTNTYTDHELFYSETIFESRLPTEITSGATTVEIPNDTMHSFNGGHNKVIWYLKVEGDIPFWPDIADTFPVRVVPHE